MSLSHKFFFSLLFIFSFFQTFFESHEAQLIASDHQEQIAFPRQKRQAEVGVMGGIEGVCRLSAAQNI